MVEKSDRHKHVNVMKELGKKLKNKKIKLEGGDEFIVYLDIVYYKRE
jgi:hypothetical protein